MNILITGTSGSGKSAVGKLLRKRGYNVIEADIDKYQDTSIAYFKNKASGKGVNMPWPPPKNWADENDWVWRVEVMNRQLNEWSGQVNFVCGDSRNKHEAYHLFDKIFVLSTDDETLKHRIQKREDNYFGKDPIELAWIFEQNKIIADEVVKFRGIVIDATKSVDEITDEVIKFSRVDT